MSLPVSGLKLTHCSSLILLGHYAIGRANQLSDLTLKKNVIKVRDYVVKFCGVRIRARTQYLIFSLLCFWHVKLVSSYRVEYYPVFSVQFSVTA